MRRRPPPRGPEPRDDAAEMRRRAEAVVAARKQTVGRRTSDESARLLHELEVHQIELEMQNAALREARTELEAALERYTDLYEFAPVGYFSVDDEGRILEVNLTGAAMLGTERSRLVGLELQRFLCPATQPTFQAFLARVFLGSESQGCEVSLRGEEGTAPWIALQAAAAASLRGTRRWCRVAASDVTAQRRAAEARLRVDVLTVRNRELDLEIIRRHAVESALRESERRQTQLLDESRRMQAQLRELSRGVLDAQEDERKRISRELHDVVGHAAIGISVHLGILSRGSAGKSAARRERVERTRKMLEEFVEVVHRFCWELRPPLLDDLGLVPAIKSFTKEFSRRTGLDVRFTSAAAQYPLDDTRKTVLYRVAQEALTNVAKHAGAAVVTVSLREEADAVCMDVADDGTAFDVERVLSAARRRRLGLFGMRERLEMVGGSFAIESAPGKGTCVRARVPRGDDGRTTGESDADEPPAEPA